jgi:hypothetical protein
VPSVTRFIGGNRPKVSPGTDVMNLKIFLTKKIGEKNGFFTQN